MKLRHATKSYNLWLSDTFKNAQKDQEMTLSCMDIILIVGYIVYNFKLFCILCVSIVMFTCGVYKNPHP